MAITITIQIDTDVYQKLETILAKNNLTFEECFNLFLTETVRQGKVPFDYTEADLEETRNNPFMTITEQ
jgi:antitoxin component of RelBE/YafQ-DinJ toxin-antitoxin module